MSKQRKKWWGMVKATRDQRLQHRLAGMLERDKTLEVIAGELQENLAKEKKLRFRDRIVFSAASFTAGVVGAYLTELVFQLVHR